MPAVNLERIGSAPFAPAPRAVRAGDYIFTSSIYPIDEAGHAVAVDQRLGEAGPSLMEAQRIIAHVSPSFLTVRISLGPRSSMD